MCLVAGGDDGTLMPSEPIHLALCAPVPPRALRNLPREFPSLCDFLDSSLLLRRLKEVNISASAPFPFSQPRADRLFLQRRQILR